MSAFEFVQEQLREDFAITSRLAEELRALRERLVRAEMRIQSLEEALENPKSEDVMSAESVVLAKSDTTIVRSVKRSDP